MNVSGVVSQVVAGQVRTVLAVGAGALVMKGADAEAVTNLQSCLAEPLIGVVLWAVAGLWSAKEKVATPRPVAPAAPLADAEAPNYINIRYPR